MTDLRNCQNCCDTPDAEERALLSAWKLGDVTAGITFARRHDGALRRFFSTKVFRDDDLPALGRAALLSLRDSGPWSNVRAELYHQAYVALHDYLATATGDASGVGTTSAEGLGTSVFRDLTGTQRHVIDALRRLPLERQIVLELLHWENLTATELAAVMGWSADEVERCRRRATRQLRAELRDPTARTEHAVTHVH